MSGKNRSLYMDDELLEQIDEVATRFGRSRSWAVAYLVEGGLEVLQLCDDFGIMWLAQKQKQLRDLLKAWSGGQRMGPAQLEIEGGD